MKVKKYEKTCNACPAQWDIYLEDGRYIYVRYRWGTLSLTLSDSPENVFDNGEVIFCESLEGPFDGYMSDEELQEITKDILEW